MQCDVFRSQATQITPPAFAEATASVPPGARLRM